MRRVQNALAAVALLMPAPATVVGGGKAIAAEEPTPASGRIPIRIDNLAGDLGPRWPAYCGVPFPKGSLRDPRHVQVVDGGGRAVASQMRRLASWPGAQSIRWLGVDFVGDPSKNYFVQFGHEITRAAGVGAEEVRAFFRRDGQRFIVNTGPAQFIVPFSGALIAQAFLDIDGNGLFGEDELLVENAGGDDLYLVDNRGREATIGRDPGAVRAEPDTAGFLEQGDALHACVRREGWYATAAGEKLARHITRLHFYRGKPFVRIQHTLVLTEDTNKVWFRDIGLRARHRLAAPLSTRFDVSHELDDENLEATFAPGDKALYVFQEKSFSFCRTDPAKDTAFRVAKVSASGSEETIKTGGRCGEWADLSGGSCGVALVMRHLWQQFPKELEVAPGAITAHLWSSRGGREFDLRTETLLKYWPEQWLSETYHRAADIERLKRTVSNARGLAKTHDLLLYLHKGSAEAARVKQIAHAFEKPVLCLADPDWIYRSQAMGPIHPYDPEHFPKVEQWYEKTFDVTARVLRQDWPDYGFLDFGSGPHCWYRVAQEGPLKDKLIAYLDRYSNADYGFSAHVWVGYVRSGKRKYYEIAEELNQQRMDIEMVHWDDPRAETPRYTNALGGKFQGGFAVGGIASPMPWGSNSYLHRHSGSDIRMLVYPYYLLDNRRAADVLEEYRQLAKKVWKCDPTDKTDHAPYAYTHRVGATLRGLASLYLETGDEEIRAVGQDWVNKLVDLEEPGAMDLEKFENIGMAKWEVKAHALARWCEATGDELARQAVLRFSRTHASLSMGDLPNSYYGSSGYYLGMAYRLSGDPAYARVLRRNMDLAVAGCEEVLEKAKEMRLGEDSLGLAATGRGVGYTPLQIWGPIMQDPPFALDAISLYQRRAGRPVPCTPVLQQARQGPATWAVFQKGTDEPVVLDVRSVYPFSPHIRTLAGKAVEGVNCEGFAPAELAYVSAGKYKSAPHSYRVTVPKDVPVGAYVLDPGLSGAPWEVTWTNATKIVLYAPKGLIVGGGKAWAYWALKGYALPAPPVDCCFLVPEGTGELEIWSSGPARVHDPAGRVAAEAKQKPGLIHLPVSQQQQGKLWKIFASEAVFVDIRGVPAFFAYGDSSRYFLPDLGKLSVKPASKRGDGHVEAPNGLFVPGAFQDSKSDRGLLLVGPRALQLDRGGAAGDHRFEHFHCLEGTLEFWFKPNWSSGYAGDRLGVLDGGLWEIAIQPFAMKFQMRNAAWTPGIWSGIRDLATHAVVPMEQGRWTHLAYQWYRKGAKFFIDAYVDGRLLNMGSDLVRENEKDHLDDEFAKSYGAPPFIPVDISERLTVGRRIDGVIDELRISDIRRYARDFSPDRSSPFGADKHTLALFHFDGGVAGVSGVTGNVVPASVAESRQAKPDGFEGAGPFVIGGRGRAATIIVDASLFTWERRREMSVVRDLARYLEQIAGSPVPIKKEAEGGAGLRLHVGRSDYVDRQPLRLKDLHIDGYVIKAIDEDNLVMVGGEHHGAWFGVYDFLKRVCGCRWFMPGPLGEVVPTRKQIVLDGLNIRSEPSVPSVWVRPIAIDNLKVKHFRRYHWAGHNLHRLMPPEIYGATHPEWYPFLNGQRRVPLKERFPWQPCVTNAALPKLVPDAAREHFASNPHSQVFSVGVNDGGGDCLCERCTQLDVIRGGVRDMSDRYAQFYNRCAEEFEKAFPDKLLGFHAYGGITHPPSRVKLKQNIFVRINGALPNVYGEFEKWSKQANRLGIYDFLYGTFILEPRHYPHLLAEHLKTLVKKHEILSYEAEFYPFWPFDAARHYVLSELLWDIDQDVDALLDDYFGNFYEESARPMKAFFQRMEDVYQRRDDPYRFYSGFQCGGFFGWKLADLEYMDGQLEEAGRLARGPTVKARIRIVDEAWRHIKCWLRIHICSTALDDMEIQSERDAETAVSYAREIFRAMAERAQWDKKVLDESRYPSKDYYQFYVASHYAKPGPLVETDTQAENSAEAVFEKISAGLVKDPKAFWRRVAQEDQGETKLSLLARTQAYVLENPGKLVNLIPDSDFEGLQEKDRPIPEELLKEHRRERPTDLPAGYGAWSYTGRPASFVWTDKLAHSGRRCVGIEANEAQACINRHVPVKPGERYRISVFATRVWRGGKRDIHPYLTIAWQGKHEGTSVWTTDARVTKSIPVGASGNWKELTLRLTVPPGATNMVIMLGINGSQVGFGGAYFDQLQVMKMFEGRG